MRKTMDFWTSLINGQIIRKSDDDFVEDYGYINEADIANWFKTLEETFDEMLSRIGVADEPDVHILGNEFKGRKSYNKRQIIKLGNDIASIILTTGIEEWMTRSGDYIEDDSERSISRVLGSSEYNVIMNALYEGVESMISTVFDTAYEGVRTQFDDPEEPDEDVERIEISPDNALAPEVIDDIWEVTEEKTGEGLTIGCDIIIREIQQNITGAQAELGEIVGNAVANKLQEPELEDLIKELSAYTFQSFMIQYPYYSRALEEKYPAEEPPISQEGVTPAEGYTQARTDAPIRQEPRDETEEERTARLRQIEEDEEFDEEDDLTPTEEADKRRKKFEDKWASSDTSSKSWMDILKTPTLTSSPGFISGKMHNVTYGKKEPCKPCAEGKKKKCCGDD